MSETVTIRLVLREVRGEKYVGVADKPSTTVSDEPTSSLRVPKELLTQLLADAKDKVDLRKADAEIGTATVEIDNETWTLNLDPDILRPNEN